jgi:hypothetical protein
MPASKRLIRGGVARVTLTTLWLTAAILTGCIPANVRPPVVGASPTPAANASPSPLAKPAVLVSVTPAAAPVVSATATVSAVTHIDIPLAGAAVTPTAALLGVTPAPTQPIPTTAPAATPRARADADAGVATVPTPVHTMTLSVPRAGAHAASPVQMAGHVSVTPFESTLRGRVYDAEGRVVGEQPLHVDAEMGQPGDFAGRIPYDTLLGGTGRVEVAEISPKDGAVLTSASVDVTLDASRMGTIEIPAAESRVALPVHVLARVGAPGQRVTVALRWHNGAVLSDTFTLLRGEDGRGLLIGSLDWQTESRPPQPASRDVTLDLRNAGGTLIAREKIQVLRPNDPLAVPVQLYWVGGGEGVQAEARVPKTQAIGAAALEQLLWGPPPGNAAGFTSAIPAPQEVLEFGHRGQNWGARVRLLDLTIRNGVAVADFSPEMAAYGGDRARRALIVEQITRTLKQFDSVRTVRITVAGQASW